MRKEFILLPYILVLVVTYSFKRRFQQFNKLISNEKHTRKHLKFSFIEVVNYCNFIFKIFRIRSCFTKSLVINNLLIRCGYKPEIHIGVNKDLGSIRSHCWVFIEDHYTEDKKVRDQFKLITKI